MTPEEKRWQKRVSARILGAKIKEFKAWLQTTNGQLALIAAITIMFMVAGILETVTSQL